MTLLNPWRDHLTPDEQSRISELDVGICNAREIATELTAERELIRRRVVGRIKRGRNQ